jgi:hypothetical protein
MKKAKNKRKCVVLFIAFLVLIYIVVPFSFVSKANRDDIHEATIRWLLHHNNSGQQDKLQVCFIGIGTTLDPEDDNFNPHDPSKEFIKRFYDFPVPTYPVSENKGYGVVDATGKRGLILAAGNTDRKSIGFVVCRGYYYEGDLSSAAYDIFIMRVPFGWVPVWARMLWIS